MEELLARGLKELVIGFLSKEWPLSAKSIYLRVRKQKACSYQAVHKMLQELLKENVLVKQDKEYALSIDWIKRLKSMTDILEKTYAKQEAIEYPKTYEFDTAIAMGRFIINRFLKLENPNNKVSVCRWRHMFSLIGLSKEEIEALRKSAARVPYYILCQKSSPFDRFLAQTYEGLGGKVLCDVEGIGDPDIFVHGDYILEVHAPRDYKREWDVLHYSYGTPDFDMNHLIQTLHLKKWRILVSVNKDPVLADQLRKETLLFFSQRPKTSLKIIQGGQDHHNDLSYFFQKAKYWRELSHDLGLPYTFYSNEKEFMKISQLIMKNRAMHAEGMLEHYRAIFDFFKKHKMQWIVQWDGLRWHYELVKQQLGEQAARQLLKNPEKNYAKYGVETRVLKKNIPFSLNAFDVGGGIRFPRDKTISGFSSEDEKVLRGLNRIFELYWDQSEHYNYRHILKEIETH